MSIDSPAAQGPEGTTTQRTPAAAAATAAPPPRTFTYDKTAGGGVVGTRGDEDEPPPASGAETGVKRFYTPVVLRMAEEHAIDLTTIQGSGAHGRVTRKDVERAIADPRATAPAPAPAAPSARAPADVRRLGPAPLPQRDSHRARPPRTKTDPSRRCAAPSPST